MVDETTVKPMPASQASVERDPAPAAGTRVAQESSWSYDGGQATSTSNSTYSTYLFGRSGQTDKPLWSDSMQGRIAIRLISRGIFGAIAFTWGQKIAAKQLDGYEPERWKFDKSKPLQMIAKGIDESVGRGIRFGAKHMAPKHIREDAGFYKHFIEDSTIFRTKNYFHGGPDGNGFGDVVGRTLGAEVVGVTFDFAMASIADATVRNVIQAFDPNNRKPWVLDKDGNASTKGTWDWGKWAQSVGRATWRIMSKNQLEDWAAAIPYVYQMKFQRQWLANKFPGAKPFLDKSDNGANLKVDRHGDIVGDYHVAGAIDLQARFVGYNWYTLMYREGYDAVGNAFNKWKEDGFKLSMPNMKNPIGAVFEGAGSFVRYTIKSFIKANIYMQPAVPFFWAMRVPQSKRRAGYILEGSAPGENAWASTQTTGQIVEEYARQSGKSPADVSAAMFRKFKAGDHEIDYLRFKSTNFMVTPGMNGKKMPEQVVVGDRVMADTALAQMHPHSWKTTKNLFAKVLNPLGAVSHWSGLKMESVVDAVLPAGNLKNYMVRDGFVKDAVDASFSYTPYMIAKAETALRVDQRPNNNELGEMDKAIYRMIDNTFAFNLPGAIRAGGDIVRLSFSAKDDPRSREGKVVEAESDEKVRAAPQTTVQAPTVARARGAAVQVEQLARESDNERERSWAEDVAGQKLAARFQPSQHTIH